MKKILFVLGGYPPTAGATDLCVANIIGEIRKEYDIVCIVQQKGELLGFEEIDGIKVYRLGGRKVDIGARHLPFIINELVLKIGAFIRKLKVRLRQIITIPIYPVQYPIYQRKLARNALSIARSENIDCVVSVCFPDESLYVGQYIKNKMENVKYIAYLIDAYSCGTIPRYIIDKKFGRRRKINYEQKVISNADKIIAMEAAKEFYEKHGKQYLSRMVYLNPSFLVKPDLNGECENDVIEKGMVNVVYAGYLYLPDRDPSYLINMISRWNRKDVSLIFIGKSVGIDIVKKYEKGFVGKINQYPFMEHQKLLHVIAQSDVLINLGVSNSNAVSGKIFEYMSFGKPIISVVFKENDASIQYLEKYPNSCLINMSTESVDDAASKSIKFLSQNLGKTLDFEEIYDKYYNSSPKAFMDQLKDVCG